MKNKKLSFRKITITKLNNLYSIKGGSLDPNNSHTVPTGVETSTDTKTNTEVIQTEDSCP